MEWAARKGRWLALALAVTASVPVPAGRVSAEDERPKVAVAAFDYSDTSGEARDQTAQHAARLRSFSEALRGDLQASGRFDVVPLSCGKAACAAGSTDAATLLARARDAGAALLLFGGIHKMSTLVQFARVDAVNVRSGGLVYDKLYTFRGDTDEAWRRAEKFVAAEVTRVLARPQP